MGPQELRKAFPIRETKASKAGLNYKAANGTVVKNYGETGASIALGAKQNRTGTTSNYMEVNKKFQ